MRKILLTLFISFILTNNSYSKVDCSQIKKLSKDYLSCLAKKTKKKNF